MIEKYLTNRNKGKIDDEAFSLYLDLLCGENCYQAKTPLLVRKIHKINNKKELVIWHIERIEKYSKLVELTAEQKEYINEIIKYKEQDNIDYYDLRDFVKQNRKLIKTSVLYSIRYANINLLEWLIIFAIAAIGILVKQYII